MIKELDKLEWRDQAKMIKMLAIAGLFLALSSEFVQSRFYAASDRVKKGCNIIAD